MKFIEKAFPAMTKEERAAHEANRGNEKAPIGLIAATFAVLIAVAVISWVM
jgi:cell division septal protein FtsQ